ncbi:MAG: hypothetical protein NZ518_10020 [Dehalococcoidia bacterium]|nr:hypothetical protein [Dehalococcoidia bacterium]
MTLPRLRRALELTVVGHALVAQGDVAAYAATLAEREPLLSVRETPVSDYDQAQAILHQIQALDRACQAMLDAQRAALEREQAALRRERRARRSYGVAPTAEPGARLQIDS